MKKLLLILLAAFCFASTQAQTYLQDGDYVTISYTKSWGNDVPRKYLEVSASGVLTTEIVNMNCILQIKIDGNSYRFKDVTTGMYLKVDNQGGNQGTIILTDEGNASAFQISDKGGVEGQYMYGPMYYNGIAWGSPIQLFVGENFTIGGDWYSTFEFYVDKWTKEGSDSPGGGFFPETLTFPYASNDTEAQAQSQNVSFTIPETAVVSYQCVSRPDEIIGGGKSDVNEGDITDFRLYWESNETYTSRINHANYCTNPAESYELPNNGAEMLVLTPGASTTKNHTFTITPIGASPMNLHTHTNNRMQLVDYADRVVAEYKYKGNLVKQTMRVVRNSYHEESLPPLTFHINPTMFTFGPETESVDITVIPIHQHGRVVYDANHNVLKTEYEEFTPAYPHQLSLKETGWQFTVDFSDNGSQWLSYVVNNNTITVTASAIGQNEKNRSSKLTATFSKTAAQQGEHNHAETLTIPLGQSAGAGVQFRDKNQKVHTATKTIYYLPGERIELRLAESNFFGYMRWYDYNTGKAPNYNFGNHDQADAYDYRATWYTTPRGANNQPFTPINTPQSAATESSEGRSYGLYAINHYHGGILDEGQENSNNTPVLNGWNYTYTKGTIYTDATKAAAGYHIIACDVSAYTDYEIEQAEGLVTSITEPTLSYRQLFDLRPAGEMADSLAARNQRSEYLEEYTYQAPAGKNIQLTPQFKYKQGTEEYLSKLGYFYWNGNDLVRVTDATWSEDATIISDNGEYLTVSGTAGTTKTYTLTANNGQAKIARFVVKFTDPQVTGPSRVVLKSKQEMNTIYRMLEDIDFNYTDEDKKVVLADGNTYYNQALDWTESTYGFVYVKDQLSTPTTSENKGFVRAADQGVFPFYGEYCLVNKVAKSWGSAGVSAEQHGGAANGFALYVDGTTEPGLVASISANATICSGQTMYCSAWLCNPSNQSHQGSNPIFRFNVQGKKGNGAWQDAGVFFVGELPKESGWQQVLFPIESAHSYDSTRVSIYNFATSGAANDFLVDDITLFVSQLPIAAYQGKMACRTSGDANTLAAAILRLDYSNINTDAGEYMYYQIFNDINKEDVDLTGDAAYYHEAHAAGEHIGETHYGSVHIPPVNFDPIAENESIKEANKEKPDNEKQDILLIYQSVSRLLDDMLQQGVKHAKAYVQTTNSNVQKWLLYVAHILENTTDEAKANTMLYDKHKYLMRMAYSHKELEIQDCNMQTELHATQQTVFELKNSEGNVISHNGEKNNGLLQANPTGTKTQFLTNLSSNCPNDLYTLTAIISNSLAIEQGGDIKDVEAPIYADWLVGEEFDDVYIDGRPATGSEEKNTADKAFFDKYGCTRGQLATAIMYDMRRVPTDKEPNPNYTARTFKELDPNAFESMQNYEIIKRFCENGWLQLYSTTAQFYLGSNDVARYWCFPIAETAKKTIDVGSEKMEVTLKDCVEPKWVTINSSEASYSVNIAPIAKTEMTAVHKSQLPTVMMVAASETVTLQVQEEEGEGSIEGLAPDGKLNVNDLIFMDMDKCQPMAKSPTLNAGDEYVVRIALQASETPVGCGAGYVFFNLQVLPKTMIWVPEGTSFNGWGKNENWKGWSDTNKDGKVQSTELSEGFVPTEDVNVVISKLDNPLLYPYIVPDEPGHEHSHYPMTVGFQPHHCKNIYFETGAMIHNQHLLEYDSAFVDMSIKQGEWTMVAAPLQSVYSGDMYIPHRGAHYADASASSLESSDPFTVVPFSGSRKSNAPYAFWISYYNKAVKNWFDNGQGQDIESNSAEFVSSNSMREALDPGSGFMLLGFGPDNYQGDSLTVRLPKSESVYYDTGGNKHSVPRTNGSKLAFTATSDAPMQITLTNKNASNYFLFGNPTMAYINMHEFLTDNDNAAVVEHGFYHVENGSWDANAQHTMTNDRYLAPMTSVMLKAKSEKSSITLTLSPDHLTLNNQISQHEEGGSNEQSVAAPKRMASKKAEPELLTIYAIVDGAYARTKLAVAPTASDYYVQGEDALFISSGVETLSEVTTPLNMYTVAEQVPMMADVRQGISEIPLSILVDESYRTNYMQLAFYYSANWSRTCYFCDSYTGQKIRIMDGLLISVEMPQNHEPRYYIEGPDMYQGSSEGGVTTSTTNPSADSQAEASFVAYSPSSSTLNISCTHLIKEVVIYDLSGRTIVQQPLDLLHSSVSLPAPSGICVVKLVLRDGTALYQQALVK